MHKKKKNEYNKADEKRIGKSAIDFFTGEPPQRGGIFQGIRYHFLSIASS